MSQKIKKENGAAKPSNSNIQLKHAVIAHIPDEEKSLAERIKNFFNDDPNNKKTDRKQFHNEIKAIFEKADIGQVSDSIIKIITNSLAFKGTPVRSVMIPTTDVVDIDIQATFDQVVKTVLSCGHSRIPVSMKNLKTGQKKIEGILYAKDLLKLLIKKPKQFSLRKLIRPVFAVPDTLPIDYLMEEFRTRRLHLAIAIDEFGEFNGIITMEDIMEEILGEFQDEYDKEKELFKVLEEGVYEVDSLLPVRDLNKLIEYQFPEENHRTVGGMVWHAFGKRPAMGEAIEIDNFLFKVKSLRRKTIGKLTVTYLAGD